jgi:hypothetical protein
MQELQFLILDLLQFRSFLMFLTSVYSLSPLHAAAPGPNALTKPFVLASGFCLFLGMDID